MSAKTPEQFADLLDSAFSWRRTEIHALKTSVDALRSAEIDRPQSRMILRAGVALLYAHWEGFGKQSCQHYLDYVAQRRLKLRELHPGLAATAIRPIFERSIKDRNELMLVSTKISELGEDRARLPKKGVVDTGSNLRFWRFSGILSSLGLDSEPFAMREHLIDVRLCDARNDIAHGDFALPTKEGVLELLAIVLEMMELLRTQLNNAVVSKEYRNADGRA